MTPLSPFAMRSYLFDTAAWRGSRRVQNMSFDERGRYRELLDEQWEHGSAPSTPEAAASELGGDLLGWQNAWPKLVVCFVPRKRDGRLINAKLAALRRERLDFLRTQREHGRRGGKRTQQKKKAASSAPSQLQGSLEPPSSLDRIGLDLIGSDRIGSNGSNGSHTRRAARAKADPPDALRAAFDAFWQAYPKKVDKADALRAWRKAKPTPDTVAKILAALQWQRTSDDWLRESGRFIPHPATWINRERWHDEPVTTPHLSDKTINLARTTQAFMNEEQS